MYRWKTRIRYSETDSDGYLSMAGLLALFQDVGYQHAQDSGFGISYTEQANRTYYLLSWQIEAYRMPAVGEQVTLSTWFYDARGPLAKKSVTMTDEEGQILAAADTHWVYMDTLRNEPATPDRALWKEKIRPAVPLSETARRLRFPAGSGEELSAFPVLREYTDTNRHVNNTRFVLLVAQAGEVGANVRFLRVEYRRQAHVGDMLYPRICRGDGETLISVNAKSGEPYAVFLFRRQIP